MFFATLTTSGAPSKDFKKLINLLATHHESESNQTILIRKQKIYQKISCTIQTLRNHNIDLIRTNDYYATVQRPTFPPPPQNYSNMIYRTFIPQQVRTSNGIGSDGDID